MNLHTRSVRFATLNIGLCLALAACFQPYTVRLNDNVLYTPNAALRNAIAEDPGLQACIDQALERNEQTDPARITLLACASAGVESLEGIAALVNLEQLELGDNAISNLSPLLPLEKLRVLGLRNNRIGDVRPLADLPLLRFLTLEGNNGIPCRQLDGLAARLGNTLGRPEACIE